MRSSRGRTSSSVVGAGMSGGSVCGSVCGPNTTGFRLVERLALGYVMREHRRDREFEIDILGERRRAIASPMPFYDPENARLQAHATE